MTRLILIIIPLFIFTFPGKLLSQQNPSGINWKTIDTGTYEIIFSEEITPLAQRVANLMVHYEKYNYADIKTKPRRIPIVLIDQYSEANGFVSFAPYYSHWFTTPSSFTSTEWLKTLSIHEGRHMVQLNKLKDGAGKKIWRILFGEAGTAVFAAVYVPFWFFEGDAVFMETYLTDGGRGRLPFFNLWFRALELADERYSYYKSYMGSYDSLLPYPDHYRLGYLLCSYIIRHYGNDVWDRVLSNTGKYFLFYTFDRSLEIETGKSIRELYTDAMNEYHALWKQQQSGLPITDAVIISQGGEACWQSHLYPALDSEGSLMALRFRGDKKLALIKQNADGSEEYVKQMPFDIASKFFYNERIFTTGGQYALWRETIPDPRWGYKSFSDLKLLNIKTGKSEYITSNRKFIASAISTDGKTAAGIEYYGMKYFLTVIDTGTGEVKLHDEIAVKDHVFDPVISPDSRFIALTSFSDQGNSILLYDTEKKKITPLIDHTKKERFTAPVFYNQYVLYGSDYSGIDNIYAVDTISKKRFQITSRPLGAYFPSVSGSTMCFNDYSVFGYQAASMELNPKKWTPLNRVKRRIIDYQDLSENSLPESKSAVDSVPDKEYEVKDYHPLLHCINVYGWIPFFSSTSTDFYFYMLSKDVLHTTDIMLGYIHNFNEHADSGSASVIYSRFYPVFTLKGIYGKRAVYLKDESKDEDRKVFVTWNEVTGSGGVSFPLNFSRGVHSVLLNFGAVSGYIRIQGKNRDDYTVYEGMDDGELHFNRYFLSYSHLVQPAMHSVSPGTGVQADISWVHTPYNGDYRGSLFSGELRILLPGFTDSQGLKLAGSYERLEYENYIFAQEVLFPRGYESLRYKNFCRGSIDYAFPILNMSVNIWKLIYLKRINGDIFFDYGTGSDGHGTDYYRSAGFELTAEQNLLSNIYLAVEAGIRYSYCIETEDNKYEFVLKAPL